MDVQLRYVLVAIALLAAGWFGGTHAVHAAPVEPTPIQLTQPDGQPFEAQPFGDEWYSGYEHNNFTILQTEDGSWTYAVMTTDGTLRPSEMRVGSGRTPPDAQPHLRDQVAIAQIPPINQRFAMAGWDGAHGAQAVLVLLVDFTPSVSLGSAASDWSNAFFDSSDGAKSVKSFYEEASFGRFTIDPVAETQGATNDGVVEITLAYEHPNTQGSTGTANRNLTADALKAADQFVDFAAYDLNDNGSLDVTELHLLVIPRGYETAFGGSAGACQPSVWGHRWALSSWEAPTLDGVRVGNGSSGGGYMQFGEWQDTTGGSGCPGASEGGRATIGIMVHELGHDINLPDLYDIDQSTSGIGYWSVMAGGSWARESGERSGTTPTLPDAFSKLYQGWITPTVVTGDAGRLTVSNSAENPIVYQLGENEDGIDWEFGRSSGEGEYYLVENRQQVGFDAGLARIHRDAQGLLIWRIDESVTSSNSANADEAHRLIDVVEANATQDMELGGSRGDRDDVWPGSNGYTRFAPDTVPSSNWLDGSESGIVVDNIVETSRGEISAEMSVPSNIPTSVQLRAQSSGRTVGSFLCLTLLLLFATWSLSSNRRFDTEY